jgi:hypothetical protein
VEYRRSIGVHWLVVEVAGGDHPDAGDRRRGGRFVRRVRHQRGDHHGAIRSIQDAHVVDDARQVARLVCHAHIVRQQARQAVVHLLAQQQMDHLGARGG